MGDGVAATRLLAWAAGCALRLREVEDTLAVSVLEVVGQDQLAVRGAQVLDGVPTLAAITPYQPRAGATGELAVAEVQPRLDQAKGTACASPEGGCGPS